MSVAHIITSSGTQSISIEHNQVLSLAPGEQFKLPVDVVPLSVLRVNEKLVIVLENKIVIEIDNYFALNTSSTMMSPVVSFLGEDFTPPDFETTLGLSQALSKVNFNQVDKPVIKEGHESLSNDDLSSDEVLTEYKNLSELYIDGYGNQAPNAVDDFFITDEDTQLIEFILANDSDPDGDPINIVDFSTTTVPIALDFVTGRFVLDLTASPDYQALGPGETQEVFFDYTIADSQGLTDSARVTVQVVGVNDVPVAVANEANTNQNTSVFIDVLANDSDVDRNQTLKVYSVDTTDTVGTVTITPDGSKVHYSPDNFDYLAEGEEAFDTFTYTVIDDANATASNEVVVKIIGINDAPIASPVEESTDENSILYGDLSSDVSDVDSEHLIFQAEIFQTSQGASVQIFSDGSYEYDPRSSTTLQALNVNESIEDSFSYTVTDSQGASDTKTVSITVHGLNDAPIASPVEESTDENSILYGDLSSDVSDVDSNPLIFQAETFQTSQGASVQIFPDGSYEYDPRGSSTLQALNVNESIVDSFSYTVTDPQGASDTKTVSITVHGLNDAPIASPVEESTDENSILYGDLSSDVSDVDSNPLIFQAETFQTSQGASVQIFSDGSYEYDPRGSSTLQALNVNESIVDSFSYTVTDPQGASDTKTVSITVHGLNDAPIASPVEESTDENSILYGDLSNDVSDVDSNPLIFQAETLETSQGASVQIFPDGSYEYDPRGSSTLQALNVNESIVDSFSYTVTDPQGASDTKTVSITVHGLNDAPIASPVEESTDENSILYGDLSSDVSDVDSEHLIFQAETFQTSQGASVQIFPDGSYEYDPRGSSTLQALNVNESIVDSFSYTVTDPQGASDTKTVSITVHGLNDAPIASPVEESTDENSILYGDLSSDVSDVDSNPLTFQAETFQTSQGASVQIFPDGSYEYDPRGSSTLQALNVNESIVDSFSYTVTDPQGASDTKTVSITVHGLNDAPIASPVEESTDENSILYGDLSSDVSDVDSNPLTFQAETFQTSQGASVQIFPDGSYEYDPRGSSTLQALNVNESIVDSFSYTVTDPQGASDTKTVSITVHGLNDAPIASPVEESTDENSILYGDLSSDVSDVDSNPLIFQAETFQTSQGASVQIFPDGSYEYDPRGSSTLQALNVNESIEDSFSYTVTDSQGASDTKTVSITVHGLNDAPIASPVEESTDENSILYGDLSSDVSDVDSNPLIFQAETFQTSQGASVQIFPDGSYEYDPRGSSTLQALNVNESIVDSFSYTVTDSQGASDTKTVSITVHGLNDAPIASPVEESTDENSILYGDLSSDVSDVDSNPLIFQAETLETSQGASVQIFPDGSYEYDPRGSSTLQALNVNESIVDSFSYTVTDPQGASDTKTVSITVHGLNDAPIASPVAESTDENSILYGDLSSDVSDVDSNPLIFQAETLETSQGASVQIFPDGSYEYDPRGSSTLQALNVNESIVDSFSYTVTDPQGASDTKTVSITVHGLNDAPIASPVAESTDENSILYGDLSSDVSDVDSNPLIFQAETFQTSQGASVQIFPDGSYEYDPRGSSTLQALNVNESIVDSFSYTVTDPQGASDTKTVSITVHGLNDAPIASPVEESTDEESILYGDLSSDVSDVDSEHLIFQAETFQTSQGASVQIFPDGSYEYDPRGSSTLQALNVNESIEDSFSYTVTDSQGASDTKIVSITVHGLNDAPIASPVAESTDEESILYGDLSSDVSDVDSEHLIFQAETFQTSQGASVQIFPDGSYEYDPRGSSTLQALNVNESIVDSFSYTVTDPQGASDTKTVSITVHGLNDAPVAENDANSTNEDQVLTSSVFGRVSDIDNDHNTLTIQAENLTTSYGASVVIQSDGTYTYDPRNSAELQSLKPNESVTDSFEYTVIDEYGASDNATVSIFVNGFNDRPIAQDDFNTTDEDTLVTGNVLDNDSDLDHDSTLVVQVENKLSTQGAAVKIQSDGSYTYDPRNSETLQSLSADETITDTFTYIVLDDHGDNSVATVTITVQGLNDAPIAEDDANSTNEDQVLTSSVFGRVSDIDNDHTLTIQAENLTSSYGASVVIQSDGTYTYDPRNSSALQSLKQNESVTDSFNYTVVDENGASDNATVNIFVSGFNDRPIAKDDFNTTDEDTLVTGNVLDNDSDLDHDSTLVVQVEDKLSTQGAAVKIQSDGSYTYDPRNSETLQSLSADETITDTFTYIVLDDHGDNSVATVTITVQGLNDAPVAQAHGNSTDENRVLTSHILDNFSDIDNNHVLTVQAESVTTAYGASVVIQSDGTYTYDPRSSTTLQNLSQNESVTDSFNYTVVDEYGASNTATINIIVSGENNAPIAQDDFNTTDENTLVTGNVLDNDVDVDNNSILTIHPENITTAYGASVVLQSDGSYTYDPRTSATLQDLNAGEIVSDSFNYTVIDEQGASDVATVTIDVSGTGSAVLINEIGLKNAVSPFNTQTPLDFIELYNTANEGQQVNQYVIELQGANVNSFIFNPVSSVTIPSKGFLVLYGDGSYQVFDNNSNVIDQGNEAANSFTFVDSNNDTLVNTLDEVGVNLTYQGATLDSFVANGASFTSQIWEGSNIVSSGLHSLPALSQLINFATFNASLGDQQSVLHNLGIIGLNNNGASTVNNQSFARVFTEDNDKASDWTTSSGNSLGSLNNSSAMNLQDLSNDDTNPGQNNSDTLAGQTIKMNDSTSTFLTGAGAPDILLGSQGKDIILGGGHDDILFGDEGNDQLLGSSGADLLVDVAGENLLVGGTGKDIIITNPLILGGNAINTNTSNVLIGDKIQQESSTQRFDVVYLVDTSGSMRNIEDLVKQALYSLNQSIVDEGFNNTASIKVFGFGNDTLQTSLTLSPSSNSLEQFIDGLSFAGSTDFEPPLIAAADYLAARPAETQKLIYFLSDGKDNVFNLPNSYSEQLKSLGVDMRVFGIASNQDATNINEAQLDQIAQLSSDPDKVATIIFPDEIGELSAALTASSITTNILGQDVLIGGDNSTGDFIVGDNLSLDFAEIASDTGMSEAALQNEFANNPVNFMQTYVVNNDALAEFNETIGVADYLVGSKGDDTIWAGAGDDIIWGREGADVIRAGQGDDLVLGSQGDDTLFGGGGADRLFGEAGDDTFVQTADEINSLVKIHGGEGLDTLMVESGDLDLTLLADMVLLDIEKIELKEDNQRLILGDTDVASINQGQSLYISTDAQNVSVDSYVTWSNDGSTLEEDGITYNIFTHNGSSLFVESTIDTSGLI